MRRAPTIRKGLRLYALGIGLLTLWLIVEWVEYYYDEGHENILHTTMHLQALNFEKQYASGTTHTVHPTDINHFYVGGWEQASLLQKQSIPFEELTDGDFFHTVVVIQNGTQSAWDDLPTTILDIITPDILLKTIQKIFSQPTLEPNPSEPEKTFHLLSAYAHKLSNNQLLYTVFDYELSEIEMNEFIDKTYTDDLQIFYTALAYITLVLFLIWLYSQKIIRSTERLTLWASQLSLTNHTDSKPNFHYQELNDISEHLYDSVLQNADALKRETDFLKYSSHELRTPIAVIQANLEYLERTEIPDAIHLPIARIQRANNNMKLISETLLWLNKAAKEAPQAVMTNFSTLTDECMQELAYLLKDKPIQVESQLQGGMLYLPETPLKIVIANLIRNAYQHAHSGRINIACDNLGFCIENHNDNTVTNNTDSSFGIGLVLTKKICNCLGWHLNIKMGDTTTVASLNWGDTLTPP